MAVIICSVCVWSGTCLVNRITYLAPVLLLCMCVSGLVFTTSPFLILSTGFLCCMLYTLFSIVFVAFAVHVCERLVFTASPFFILSTGFLCCMLYTLFSIVFVAHFPLAVSLTLLQTGATLCMLLCRRLYSWSFLDCTAQ